MKKKIQSIATYILLLLPLWGLGSCSMDLDPQGAIPDTEALETVSDYRDFSIGLSALMRNITTGDYVVLSDIQLDDFNAVIGNGNRRMEFYNGQVMPSTGEIASIYLGYYSVIAQTNFMIEHGIEKLKDSKITTDDKTVVGYYIGVAYFYRAYCYSCLADKFCQSYKNCTDRAKEGTGLSLQLVYAPSADNSKYPGRSSLVKTYEQIVSDLNNAHSLINAAGVSNPEEAERILPSVEAVQAMLARVYLNMGEDGKAATIAEELVKNKHYSLISNKKAFHDMWFRDNGSEIIWKVSADYIYHGSATGSAFCNNDQNPDYVPNNSAIYLFDENDSRWYAWFDNDINENTAAKQKLITNSGGSASMFLFAKYPGNPTLQPSGASGSNFINMSKPLRIGEMYLVAAEAYANQGNELKAKEYLAAIENARSAGGNISSLTGTKLMEEIYNERHRELMGEGLRQADLKRWNIGCVRSDAFDGMNNVIISNYRNLQYNAGDYRLVWPIPQHEIDSNPQMNQNPGYGNNNN